MTITEKIEKIKELLEEARPIPSSRVDLSLKSLVEVDILLKEIFISIVEGHLK